MLDFTTDPNNFFFNDFYIGGFLSNFFVFEFDEEDDEDEEEDEDEEFDDEDEELSD